MATISVVFWGLFIAYRIHVLRKSLRLHRKVHDEVRSAMNEAHRLQMEWLESAYGVKRQSAQIIPFPEKV